MAEATESRGPDSDGDESLTAEQSDIENIYPTNVGSEQHERNISNIQLTGSEKNIPVILFNADTILKRADYKTVGERYHLAFKFVSIECKIVRDILLSHGFLEVDANSTEYNLIWSGVHPEPSTLQSMSGFQKINHFPGSVELARKDRLFENIQEMQQKKSYKQFNFIPQSFILPGGYKDFYKSFLKYGGLFIVKPFASSRGRGVFLINHPDQICSTKNLIVSRYISSPLLIDGFKFDMRIYVAVTSYNPLLIYVYNEGLVRFATVKYTDNMESISNRFMHLTNSSVNKESHEYVRNTNPNIEDYGSKWSMRALLRYMRSQGIDTKALMEKIHDVIIKTIISAESSIAESCKLFQPFRGNCFELYGFDILLDDTLKPWVLEVNFTPSMACDGPLDLKIKAKLLCDLLSLAGIVCHDPRSTEQVKEQAVEITAKLKRRTKSAVSSASKEQQAKTALGGLNREEINIVRRLDEEETRKGGWVRIFPNGNSWETHSAFLQFPTTHNLMLHQRLYQESMEFLDQFESWKRKSKETQKEMRAQSSRSRAHLYICDNPGEVPENMQGHQMMKDQLEEQDMMAAQIVRTFLNNQKRKLPGDSKKSAKRHKED